MTAIDNRFRRLATAAAFASLFTYAVVMTVIPASINEIGRAYHVSTTALGSLFRWFMVGFFVAAVLGGRYSDRAGKLPALLAGSVIMGIGSYLFMRAGSFTLALGASLLMGVGGGFSEALATAMIADLYSSNRRTAMMNWSQVTFSVGAVACPLGVARLLQAGADWRAGFIWAAAMCLVAMVVVAAALATGHEMPLARSCGQDCDWSKLVRDPFVIALCVGIMLYVGAEIGIANWLAAYFEMSLRSTGPVAAAAVAVFWVGVGAGRVAATRVSPRMPDLSLICWCTGLATAAAALVLLAGRPVLGLEAVFAYGFCMGPVWPTIVSRAGAAHPAQSGTVIGMVVASGCMGAAIFPPTVGWLADLTSMRTAMSTSLALLVINLAMFLRLRSTGRRHEG